jgi:hypothetical protein
MKDWRISIESSVRRVPRRKLMPKLSKSRIINLNYNDGKRTIYNEIFDYGDGKDTLFSMENGIGKTVLIQFFMQPFIRNKRELAGRKFEDYFTSNAPTYIMHEVLLDNGEKLLVGMIIKKESSEEEKNKVRILAFLNKYSRPNDFDLINAPFVEGKRILKFSEAEEKIKKYKKLNFKFYNFNDNSKKNEYFEDLKAFKLNYKEWEDIIRSINNDESGLSNLYDKHKTDEALIRNVIIPLIESKVNGEKNAIESIRNNLSKYIESYKQSKESFHEIDMLKTFQGEMVPITELLKDGVLKEENREALYKRLAGIALLCEEEFLKKSSEKRQLEDYIEELNNELLKVHYEQYSLEFYNLQNQANKLTEEFNEVSSLHLEKASKFKELVKEKYIQECAEVYEEHLVTESELIEKRERIANFEREDSEIAQSIRNYKYTLKSIYEKELNELREKELAQSNNISEVKKKLEDNANKQKVNASELEENIRREEALKNKIGNFEKTEGGFRKSYNDFTLQRNLFLNEYDSKEMEKFSLSIEGAINQNTALKEKLKNETLSLVAEKENLKEKHKAADIELTQSRSELQAAKKDLQLFEKETAKILEILRIKDLPLKPDTQKAKLKELLSSENIKLQDTLEKEKIRLRELEDTVHRYETGLIQLPKEVLESFENKGISFQYALNWLQNYKGTKEEKENLIKSNPFFPYGILINAKDINLLKSESIDVYTSIPIPIINKSDLNRKLNIDKSNDILTIENQEFLVAFNYLLIDEEERIELIKDLNMKMQLLNTEINNIQNAIDRNKGYEMVLSSYSYIGDEDTTIKTAIGKLEKSIEVLLAELKAYNAEMDKNDARSKEIISEIHRIEKELINLDRKKERFKEFQREHEEFKKYNYEISDIRKSIKELKKNEIRLTETNQELQGILRNLEIEVLKLEDIIRQTSNKLNLYSVYNSGVQLEEDKLKIEAKLQACEKELGDNIKRDKEDEVKLSIALDKVKNRLHRKAKEGDLSQEYKNVAFSEARYRELNNSISIIENDINKLKEKINKLDKDLSVIEEKKKRTLEDINKLGFEEPISKEQIKDSNFRGREKKIKEDLKENADIIKEYIEDIDKLRLLKQKLEFYKSYSNAAVEVEFDFKNLSAAIKNIDDLVNSYGVIKKEIDSIESKITKDINSVYEKYRDRNRFIKERLFSYLTKERKIQSSSDIESLLEIVDRRVSTLELELSAIKSEEEVVINEILRYSDHVLQELKTIDKKSNIKHLGKTQKLLEISIPEEKEEESLKEYIKAKVQYYSSLEEDYSKLLENDIQSAELLSKLIGNINRIRVDIKKIEKTGLVRKSWKDALSQNSGGEKFVSMFILLSSLMSYMRRRETDIDTKEEKKILIMDNPFAKTNAEHLLEPMFQIAEKYNIQLLCFSGIGGSAVYNRFDKIYVAKVVEDKFRNKENVSFKAGSEETLELSDFTVSKEQISMF